MSSIVGNTRVTSRLNPKLTTTATEIALPLLGTHTKKETPRASVYAGGSGGMGFLSFVKAPLSRGKGKAPLAAKAIKTVREASAGGKATSSFIPKTKAFEKEKSIKKLQEVMTTLNENIQKWNEADLSKYQLPHPLLGKLSIREMMLFTAIHTEHHFKALKDNY